MLLPDLQLDDFSSLMKPKIKSSFIAFLRINSQSLRGKINSLDSIKTENYRNPKGQLLLPQTGSGVHCTYQCTWQRASCPRHASKAVCPRCTFLPLILSPASPMLCYNLWLSRTKDHSHPNTNS